MAPLSTNTPPSCCESSTFSSSHRISKKKECLPESLNARVQADFDAIVATSPFLQRPPLTTKAAYFARSEILTANEPLGRGGYCEVFEIVGFCLSPQVSSTLTLQQEELRQDYAKNATTREGRGRFVLKQLQAQMQDNNYVATLDLALEAAFLQRFQHDHIVTLRGLPVSKQEYFVILDRLTDTLEERMETWTLQEQPDNLQKQTYALQLASALQYLHERRIVFRDFKPQNIGFTDEGQLQLFDFGLCRELPIEDHSSRQGYLMSGVGTRRYMAPEVVLEACYNTRADVYSWAMVVWQIFTKTQPYPGHTINQHYTQVCLQGERPPMTGAIPLEMQQVLNESWCDASNRLTMAEIQDRLAQDSSDSEPDETEITVTEQGIEVSPKTVHNSSPFLYHMFEQDNSATKVPFKLPPSQTTDTTCTECTCSDLSLDDLDEASLILSTPLRVPNVIHVHFETKV